MSDESSSSVEALSVVRGVSTAARAAALRRSRKVSSGKCRDFHGRRHIAPREIRYACVANNMLERSYPRSFLLKLFERSTENEAAKVSMVVSVAPFESFLCEWKCVAFGVKRSRV